MTVVFEKQIEPTTGQPETPADGGDGSILGIAVVFTTDRATLAALKHAATLARNLSARVTLLVPQIVPYPRPITSPPVMTAWNEHRLRAIAAVSPVDTVVRLYLCRDYDEMLRAVLPRHALVVVGSSRKWLPFTSERRLVRKLQRAGHEAVLIEAE